MTGFKELKGNRLTRRTFLKGVGVAGGVLALAGPLSFRALGATPPTIPVGSLLAFTGALAEMGPAMQKGGDLAAADINSAAQEVFGGPIIKLIQEDSGTASSVAVDAARKLVSVNRVPAIVGALSSGVSIAVAESVTIPDEVLQVSPASTSPLISILPADKGHDFLFRTVASDALQGVVAAQLAAGKIFNDYKFKTASTIYVNNPYGQGLSNVFSRSFQLRGGIIEAQVPHPDTVQPTYTAELALALANKPEVLLVVSYPGHAGIFLKESRDIFNYTSWQFTDGTKSLDLVKDLGAKALAGKYGTAPGADPNWPGFEKLVAEHQAKYGTKITLPYVDTTYDAVAAVGLAIGKVIAGGITDPAKITGTVVRNALRPVSDPPGTVVGVGDFKQAFQLLKAGTDINYSGAAGSVDFDKNGDVITPMGIWEYTAQGTIKSVEIRTAKQIPQE